MTNENPPTGVETEHKHRKSTGSPSSVVKVTDITPRFKLVFATVLAITILCLFLNLVIVLAAPAGASAESFADTCSTAFKLGFGAIVGLVGGKVT
jgi:hypothetical protein